ncbi:hypothetical protein FA15DRAFT_664762 [Coprinopsis marcescibilis]|uniref:LON-domain-containing protein n=1 Tax=Coprinopsis marcescibilis TaxID=230819 RepID=A0A5C3L7K6_COPMA|nr:hypothetical protein FA15DRAFT_664762 [Coprinopsis marcescibilis]
MLSQLKDALKCKICRKLLVSPITLHCGHCLCAHHLPDELACPVPACVPLSPTVIVLPHIHPNSNVLFAVQPPEDAQEAKDEDDRVTRLDRDARDVSVTRILALFNRISRSAPQARTRPPPDDGDDDSDSDARPRKRRKRADDQDDSEPSLVAHLRTSAAITKATSADQPLPSTTDPVLTELEKDLSTELNCDICSNLFYQPVTTPCQHTFCAKCLQRSLDHNPTCPLCRTRLPGYGYFQDHPLNDTLLQLLFKFFNQDYDERRKVIAEEERAGRLDTPIFIATLSFPGLPTAMHIFEPRYRLMLRRCLESPRPAFGMVAQSKPGERNYLADYGTMLEIRRVVLLNDGRSIVQTWGSYRFRILDRGNLDGYIVAKIERIDDYPDDLIDSVDLLYPVAGEDDSPSPLSTSLQLPQGDVLEEGLFAQGSSESSPSTSTPGAPVRRRVKHKRRPNRRPSNAELIDICKKFLERLQRGTNPWVVQKLARAHGEMPSDPALVAFWVASVLPIDETERKKLLPIRSARLRLLLVTHWIEQLNSNWWFSRGCTIL